MCYHTSHFINTSPVTKSSEGLSDHYGQIFEVDKSLFQTLTPKFPEEMAAEEMEEEIGNDPTIDVLKNVLHDIDNPFLPFFDTSPHPTMDAMDDDEEEEVMELCSSLSEYIDISSVLALDPNRSGYVSCADLQTLMSQQSTELKSRGADPKVVPPPNLWADDYECIASAE